VTLKIAITQRVVEHEAYQESRDALSHDWVVYLEAILPEVCVIPVPNQLDDVASWCSALAIDGIILSNGNDLGESKLRDTLESTLIAYAVDHDLPLLGVCRGFQLVNQYFGGDINTVISIADKQSHVCVEHGIELTDAQFQQFLERKSTVVNSFHNQGVLEADIAPSLKSFAQAGSVIEGLYHAAHKIVAIQWHPERSGSDRPVDAKLIQALFIKGKWWK